MNAQLVRGKNVGSDPQMSNKLNVFILEHHRHEHYFVSRVDKYFLRSYLHRFKSCDDGELCVESFYSYVRL